MVAPKSCLAYQPCATATMTDDKLLPFDLPAVRRKKLTVDFEGGNQSSNGGALLLREAERDVGVCRRLAETMPDRRDPDHIQHQMVEMVTARVTAIACGHEDAIDHNDLRHDPLMKVAVGRCPESGAPLGSQSTISRLENAPSKTDAARLTVARWWPRPPTICASITPRAARRSCAPMRASPTRPELDTAAQSGGAARMFAAA